MTVGRKLRWALRTLTGLAAASSASHCRQMASPFLKGDLSGTFWAATEAGQKGIVGMGLESQRMGQRVGGRRHADREFSKTNERQQVTDSCKCDHLICTFTYCSLPFPFSKLDSSFPFQSHNSLSSGRCPNLLHSVLCIHAFCRDWVMLHGLVSITQQFLVEIPPK